MLLHDYEHFASSLYLFVFLYYICGYYDVETESSIKSCKHLLFNFQLLDVFFTVLFMLPYLFFTVVKRSSVNVNFCDGCRLLRENIYMSYICMYVYINIYIHTYVYIVYIYIHIYIYLYLYKWCGNK